MRIFVVFQEERNLKDSLVNSEGQVALALNLLHFVFSVTPESDALAIVITAVMLP